MSTEHTVVIRAPGFVPVSRTKPTRVKLRTPHKVTRAHLAVQNSETLRQAAHGLAAFIASELTTQLHVPVTMTGVLRSESVLPLSHLSRSASFALLELGAVDALAVLELEQTALNSLLQRIAGSSERSAGPFQLTRIESAALGWLTLCALKVGRQNDLIERHFAPRLVQVFDDRSQVLALLDCRDRMLAIDLAIDIDGVIGKARLLIPSLAVQEVAQKNVSHPSNELNPNSAAACVDARFRVGSAHLTSADLQSLTAGDVILLSDARLLDEVVRGAARLDTRHFALFGELSTEGFTFQRCTHRTTNTTKEPFMSDNTMPVDVEVELTRLRLTLSELANLKPGTVLPLMINGAQPITLCVGDKAIARADLVDVDGELGARITELF